MGFSEPSSYWGTLIRRNLHLIAVLGDSTLGFHRKPRMPCSVPCGPSPVLHPIGSYWCSVMEMFGHSWDRSMETASWVLWFKTCLAKQMGGFAAKSYLKTIIHYLCSRMNMIIQRVIPGSFCKRGTCHVPCLKKKTTRALLWGPTQWRGYWTPTSRRWGWYVCSSVSSCYISCVSWFFCFFNLCCNYSLSWYTLVNIQPTSTNYEKICIVHG